MTIQLHYAPATASMIPHLLLEEMGTPFELVLVDNTAGAHRQPAYLKLNPNGLLPALTDGDLELYETAAICLHLCDTHPVAGLAPAVGTVERAHFYKWLVWLTNTLQSALIVYFYPQRWANEASISCQGMRLANTASGWRKSIIWSRRLRKKSSVMTLLSKTPRKQAPLNIDLGVLTIRNHPRSQVFMRGAEVLQGRLLLGLTTPHKWQPCTVIEGFGPINGYFCRLTLHLSVLGQAQVGSLRLPCHMVPDTP